MIEHIDILIVVSGNENVVFIGRLCTDGVLGKHDEVRRFVLIKVDDLLLCKIRGSFCNNLLHFTVVGLDLKCFAQRQTRSAGQPCTDREVFRKQRSVCTECAVYIFARRHIISDAVNIRRIILVDKRDKQLCRLALRRSHLNDAGLTVKIQICHSKNCIRGERLQRLCSWLCSRLLCTLL